MNRFFTRIAVTSVAFVLICVIVVAQTENATKSVTSHRLTVSPNPVNLVAGESTIVEIMPNPGYYHPTIFYNTKTYEVGQPFEGRIFTVEAANPSAPYRFVIRAKDVKTEDYESIDIDVEENPNGVEDRNMVRFGGVTLTINVTPRVKKQGN